MIKTPEFLKKYEEMKKISSDTRIFGSTDRLSFLSGVAEKLQGYKQFLNKSLAAKVKTKLIQVIISF